MKTLRVVQPEQLRSYNSCCSGCTTGKVFIVSYKKNAKGKSEQCAHPKFYQNIKLKPFFCEALNRSISKASDFFNCIAIKSKKG